MPAVVSKPPQPQAGNPKATPTKPAPSAVNDSSNPIDQFVKGVAQQTGLDPAVVEAWVIAEGAYTANGTGHYNYLNVRPNGTSSYSGVPLAGVSSGNFQEFNNVNDAITETVHWINTFGNYSGIRASARLGPLAQISAITASPWDQGNYAGGKLYRDYQGVISGGASLPGGGTISKVASAAGGIAAGVGKGAAAAASGDPFAAGGDVVAAVTKSLGLSNPFAPLFKAAEAPIVLAQDATKATVWAVNPQHWLRVGYVLGGGLLVLVGTVLLARSAGALSIAGGGVAAKLPSKNIDLSGGGSSGPPSGPIASAPRREQRRVGFESSSSRAYQGRQRRARARAAAERAQMSEEIPF